VRRLRVDFVGLCGILAMLAVWQIVSVEFGRVVPSPAMVAKELFKNFLSAPTFRHYGIADAGYLDAIVYTAGNVTMSMLIGGPVGILLGLLTSRRRLLRSALDPIFLTLGTIPIFIAAPFLLLWFGISRFSAVTIVAIYISTIVYAYSQRALHNLSPVYEQYAQTLGADGHRLLWDVMIPGTLPEVLGGLRIALAGAWGLAAISELIGSQRGAGKVVQALANSVDVKAIFCVLLLLGLAAAVIDAFMARVISRVTAWNSAGSHDHE
jgi:ABC-type nitrate/sulfonate/bicarbonate transport system permease component